MNNNIIETLTADHGIIDRKGRAVGGVATIRPQSRLQCSVCNTVNTICCGKQKRVPTGKYAVRVMPTRAGQEFGAAFPAEPAFDTIEECRAEATRKFAAQAKRYAKQAAAGKL